MAGYRNWRWWTIALRGLAAIGLGLLAISSPQTAFVSFMVLFGLYAIVDGCLAFALGNVPRASKGAMYGRGLVSIVAGVLAIAMPTSTGVALLYVIASWAIVSGVLDIVLAVHLRRLIDREVMLGLEGAVSIAFGIVLFISPASGAIALALWVGAYALVIGGMLIATGFRLREDQALVRAIG
jgi:uncharacterized membrane protein HdeD (DUF308 family)